MLCKSESIKELATALCKAQALMEGAKKDKNNPFFKSKYANLESVWECARVPLTDNGLSVVQMPGKSELGHFLETTLMHSSGEYISGRMFISPIKEDPQGIGSAITYARRYSLMAALGIAPEDDDGEAAMGRGRENNAQSQERSLPGSKAASSQKQEAKVEPKPWREVIWHVPNIVSEDKAYSYKGQTLQQILDADPSGLLYWFKTFKPLRNNATAQDKALREALDEAGKELSNIAPPPVAPTVIPDDLPENATKKELLAELQYLCASNHVLPAYIVEQAIEFKRTPPETKTVSDFTEELLRSCIKHFSHFVTASKEA